MTNDISITYCVPCGYEKRARAAADQIKDELNIDISLIPGSGGVFKVTKGEETLAQRTREHFPTPDEITRIVKQAVRT